MALLTTIQEVQEVLPKMVSNLNDPALMPNFEKEELNHLIPIIGPALYSDLIFKKESDTLSDTEQTLVKKVNLVTASYAFLAEAAASHILLTDQGLKTQDVPGTNKIVGWEYKAYKQYLKDSALEGTEALYSYLLISKDSFPLWTNSPAYLAYNELYLRSGNEFTEHYNLYHPNRTFAAFKDKLRIVQLYYHETGLGKALFRYFLELQDPTPEEIEIEFLLKKALAYLTIKHAAEFYTFRLTETGFTIISEFGGDREGEEAGRAEADLTRIKILMSAAEREGVSFFNRAKNKLVTLRSSIVEPNAFTAAFDAGPLIGYVDPVKQSKGNERRKSFRF